AELGSLGESGLPIDDPANVRPVELHEGRLRFAFEGKLWSRDLVDTVASFARESGTPPGSTEVPSIAPATGAITFRPSSELDPLNDPMLGAFSAGGRYDAAT